MAAPPPPPIAPTSPPAPAAGRTPRGRRLARPGTGSNRGSSPAPARTCPNRPSHPPRAARLEPARLAGRLAEHGRGEGLGALEEAVLHYRELVNADPASYRTPWPRASRCSAAGGTRSAGARRRKRQRTRPSRSTGNSPAETLPPTHPILPHTYTPLPSDATRHTILTRSGCSMKPQPLPQARSRTTRRVHRGTRRMPDHLDRLVPHPRSPCRGPSRHRRSRRPRPPPRRCRPRHPPAPPGFRPAHPGQPARTPRNPHGPRRSRQRPPPLG